LVSSARVPVPPEDEIDQLLFDMRNQLNPGWRHDERQILDAASSAGFTVIDQRLAAPDQVTQSPAEIADGIEAKTWSSLWNLTNEQWQAVVAPTVAALRASPMLTPTPIPQSPADHRAATAVSCRPSSILQGRRRHHQRVRVATAVAICPPEVHP
jgi:hypothetical protein